MPGLCPGECGRRIAGRDACPTQRWASAPTGRLRAAFNGFSLRFPKVTDRTAGRCGFQFILRKNRTSGLPLPWTFGRSPMRHSRALSGPENAAGRLGNLPSLPALSVTLMFQISGAKLRSTTTAHKCPNTAFQTRSYLTWKRGTQALTEANTGVHSLMLSCPKQTKRHWQRRLRQEPAANSQIFRLLGCV